MKLSGEQRKQIAKAVIDEYREQIIETIKKFNCGDENELLDVMSCAKWNFALRNAEITIHTIEREFDLKDIEIER